MLLRDTLILSDTLQYNVPAKIQPADSLWGSETLDVIIPGNLYNNLENQHSNYFKSGATLVFIILLLLFFRAIANSSTTILKSFFKFKSQLATEDKLSEVRQRNITALISSLTITLIFAYTFEEHLWITKGIRDYSIILGTLALMATYWLTKTILLRFSGWITSENQPFNIIGKLGYNHFIVASILTLPVILLFLTNISTNVTILFHYLLVCYLLVYIVYLIRVWQTIITYHFSHVFYILYLCTAEILPIALLINFILSNQ